MSERNCPSAVSSESCMPVWLTDIAPECLRCIQRALSDPSARANEDWNVVDQDKFPHDVERIEADRLRALTGCKNYNRVFKRETGPFDTETNQHVIESRLDLYFNCDK